MLWILDHATSRTIADSRNCELDALSSFEGLMIHVELDHAEGIDSKAIRRHVMTYASVSTRGKDGGI